MPRITCITRIWQAKACFFKHELSLINHELTINGWRGLLFLRVIALRIENPYNSLRQIANLPQLKTRILLSTLNSKLSITYNP